MTEGEAKTKWCPFARPGQVRPEDCGEVRGNRMMQGEVDSGALCIGSACMAWRGNESADFKRRAETAYRRDGHRLSPTTPDTEGFCGLAGRPS